jgi:hypothetical protein
LIYTASELQSFKRYIKKQLKILIIMAFEIKVIDTFITECKASGKEITYDNFAPLNEGLNSDIQVPLEIFEAYVKYADISGTDMVTLMEFEKIKSFSEFVDDKKSNGDDAEVSDDDDDDDNEEDNDEGGEEPATEEPAKEEPAAEEPATEEPAKEEPAAEEPAKEEGEEDKEDDTMDVKVEGVSETVQSVTNPSDKVAKQPAAKSDDAKQQTVVDLETGNGAATAGKIEDTIVKLGEPEKKADKEGEALVGEASAEVQLQPEDIKAVKGESTDDTHNTDIPTAKTDGSATAKKVEDTINDLGEPEKKSEKEGEKLLGESEEEEKKTLN